MQIKEMPERKTEAVRRTVSVDALPATVGKAYHEVMTYVEGEDATVVGPPFVIYHNDDMQALDVEIGFPVDRDVGGEERVRPGLLPGGRVLSHVHVGPYSTLEEAYTPLMKHIEEQGLKVTGWMYELYLNSPDDTPDADLRTEICFPLAE